MACMNTRPPSRAATPEIPDEDEAGAGSGPRLLSGPADATSLQNARLQTQPAPLTPAQRQDIMRAQARAIDEQFEEQDACEILRTVSSNEGDFRGLVFEPDITPNDPRWVRIHQMFQNDLTTKAISTVLDDNFEDWQKSLILPPERSEAIVEVQARNKIKYDDLRSDPQFGVTQNNAILKLTMAHFGLPVEPFTMNNVMNAGTDADDEADPDPEPPRVQRIIYAEKPLEFLDSYHKRSHGFPMLRRPVHLRGGSGKGTATANIPALAKTYWLYEHGGRKLEIRKSASAADEYAQFERIVKTFLGLDVMSTGRWECVVDQYREKNMMKECFTRTFQVDSQNYQYLWTSFLKSRVFNPHGSWIMVVRPPRGSRVPAPKKFAVNGRVFAAPPRKPADTGKASTKKTHLSPFAASSPKMIDAISGTNKTSTSIKPIKVLNFLPVFLSIFRDKFGSREFILAFYSKRLDRDVNPDILDYDHRIIFNGGDNKESFAMAAPLIFGEDARKRWLCIAYQHAGLIHDSSPHVPKPTMPQPPRLPTQSTVPGDVPIWTISPTQTIGYNTKNSADEFRNTALRVLGIDASKVATWEFGVDMYSWVLNAAQGASSLDADIPVQFRIRVNQANLQNVFTDFIAPRIFELSATWAAVIRQTAQRVAELLTKGKIQPLPVGKIQPLPEGQPLPRTRPETPRIILPSSSGGIIFGYAGQLRSSNQQLTFIQTAKDLLAIEDSPTSNWEFRVDVFTRGTFTRTQRISQSGADAQFTALQTSLNEAGWTVFVRIGGLLPTDLEPPINTPNIVKLECPGRGTAYWKIWRNSAEKQTQAGVNQFQPGFQRAMKVLFPSRTSNPAARIRIATKRRANNDTFELPVGGLELTTPILNSLNFELNEVDDPGLLWNVRWSVQVSDAAGISPGHRSTVALGAGTASTIAVGIHLVGSNIVEAAEGPERGIAQILGDRISEISDARLRNKPENFRLWYSATGRAKGTPDKVIRYEGGSGMARAADIWTFFRDNFTTEGPCTYVWFRPEYTVMRIADRDDGARGVDWDCALDSSLKSFRAQLERLFALGGPSANTQFFKVIVADAPGPSQEFTVDPDTSEDEWRLHVFDALRSNSISIVKNLAFRGIVADIDASTPWGILESRILPEILPAPPPRTLPGRSHPRTSTPSRNVQLLTPPDTRSRIKTATQRFNKERILKAQVTRAVPQQWDPWIQEQSRLDRLKQTSYVRDQSVIEPGQKPEPPIFGPSKELLLSVGTDMPQTYAQRLTPTDIIQLRDENQRLRNHILEREVACFLCDASFPKHKPEEKRAHFKLHTDTYATGPMMCPWCLDPNWAFWSPTERKSHLETDFAMQRGKEKNATLQDVFCPICHKDLNGLKTEHVMAHIAGHTPDVLKWCDRCGRNNTTMDPVEILYHKKVCIDARPRDITAAPYKFCGVCGQDVTKLTDKQFRDHKASKLCTTGLGQFCTVCALDLSLIHNGLTNAHEKNCRPPSGPQRRFCNRCGVNEWELNDRETASHTNDCLSRDPRPFKDQKKLDEITVKIRQESAMRAKNQRERMELNKIRDGLKDQTSSDCDELKRKIRLLEQKSAQRPGELFSCPFSEFEDRDDIRSATRPQLRQHIVDEHSGEIRRMVTTFRCRLSKMGEPDTICDQEVSYDAAPPGFEPAGGVGIESHDEHIKNKHMIMFVCPIIKANGEPCREEFAQNYKNTNKIIDHLRKHSPAGVKTPTVAQKFIKCTLMLDNGTRCTKAIRCDDGGNVYKIHLQEAHRQVLFFTCPLLRANGERCGSQIFYPIGDKNEEAFRSHYSHHMDDLTGLTSEQVQEHVRKQTKVLQDITARLKPAAEKGAKKVTEGEEVEKTDDGFPPSPAAPNFPERKRKYDEALRERARKPGETIQEYSQRLKRMRTAAPEIMREGKKRAREVEVEVEVDVEDKYEEEEEKEGDDDFQQGGSRASDESEKSDTGRSARRSARTAGRLKKVRK